MHDAVQAGGLAVVAPSDRLAVDVSEEGGDVSLPYRLRHVAPVVGRRAHGPLLIGLRAVRLHAVARLPAGKIAKGVMVEEGLVVPDSVRRHIVDRDLADAWQARDLSLRGRVVLEAQALQDVAGLRREQARHHLRRIPRQAHPAALAPGRHVPYQRVLRLLDERRRVKEPGAHDEPPGRRDIDDL